MPVPIDCACFTNPPDLVNQQPVDADTLQPILQALYNNDLYLKGVLDYFQVPSALMRCVKCNTNVQVGQPVYYSSVTDQYELSQYGATQLSNGTVVLDDSAEVWGLVLRKSAADQATILVDGIHAVDLTNSYGSSTVTGKLYLGSTPGQLTTTPPDDCAPVYVLSGSDSGSVLFRPWSGEYTGIVLQWKHELSTQAAGTFSVTDKIVSIDTPDDSVAGWLPANHASFGGNAPAGAVFGYNIAQDATLLERWPVRYQNTTYLEFDRGRSASILGQGVPLGPDGLAIVDENGIWWMSDCAEDAPWDALQLGPPCDDCPMIRDMRLTMFAARPAGAGLSANQGQTTLVSQHPALTIKQRGTLTDGTKGDLDLDLDPTELILPGDNLANTALKAVSGKKIETGPIVSRITSANDSLVITGTEHPSGGYYGSVSIDVADVINKEIQPQTIALNRAEEESYGGTLGIGLTPLRTSGFLSAFLIPTDLIFTANVRFQLWAFAKATGADPGGLQGTEDLTCEVTVVNRPDPTSDVSSLSPLAISLESVPVNHAVAYRMQTGMFTVEPGDIVYINVTRVPQNTAFEIHVIRQMILVDSIVDGFSPFSISTTTCHNYSDYFTSTTEAPTTTS